MFVFFVDFAPRLFWWVLVGNVRTLVTAALVALGTALALMSLLQRRGLKILPIGSGSCSRSSRCWASRSARRACSHACS